MQGMKGMPPPPAPENDAGFTEEELSSQLADIGSSDSKRSELISKVLENFDEADTDGDGKVSFKEAMALEQSTRNASTSGTHTSAAPDSASTAENNVLKSIMQLMQAYQVVGQDSQKNGIQSALSITA